MVNICYRVKYFPLIHLSSYPSIVYWVGYVILCNGKWHDSPRKLLITNISCLFMCLCLNFANFFEIKDSTKLSVSLYVFLCQVLLALFFHDMRPMLSFNYTGLLCVPWFVYSRFDKMSLDLTKLFLDEIMYLDLTIVNPIHHCALL